METRTLLCHVYKAIFLSKSQACNSSNKTLIRVLWPFCTCPAYILTLLKVSNHYHENCRSCRDTALLGHTYVANLLNISRLCNSSNKIWSEFCDLYAYAQPISLLCCKFQIIRLKTAGEVAETRIYLCHAYKVIFLSKSMVRNSYNKNLIRVLWPLCTCPAYILTLLQSLSWKLNE